MARDRFVTSVVCPGCSALGAATWEENAQMKPAGPQRRLIEVHGEFHTETGRTQSGDPVIVCNNCDAIQTD